MAREKRGMLTILNSPVELVVYVSIGDPSSLRGDVFILNLAQMDMVQLGCVSCYKDRCLEL